MKTNRPIIRVLMLIPVFALLVLCAYIYLNGWDDAVQNRETEESALSRENVAEAGTEPSSAQAQQTESDEAEENTASIPENLPQPVEDASFDDVTEADWFYEGVMRAARLGLISGSGEGIFEPYAQISRGDFAVLAARLKGADLSAYVESGFEDVPGDAYYASSVAYVNENGYMGGYVDGSFRPQEGVTRAEMATILCRIIELEPIEEPEPSARFYDHEAISSWALGYAYAARDAGLMTGNTTNEFSPQDITPRCQAAVLVLKCYDLMYSDGG